METTKVRAIIALTIVIVSMMVIAALALLPVFVDVDHDHWSNVYGKMVSPITGILGVVVGYYFAKD